MFGHGAVDEGLDFAQTNFVILEPKCTWTWQDEPHAWIDELFVYCRDWSRIDSRKTYVVGFSQGGMSTWECAARMQDRVTACVPVGAHHNSERTQLLAQRLRGMPIWAWHSRDDQKCRIGGEEKLWDALTAAGSHRLHVNTVRGLQHHQVFNWALNQTAAIYRWLLLQESED